MPTTTQSILCCIGQSVAGKPTQFLLERAISATHLDWRVITVEVEAEKFRTAVEGMAALRFVAIRFFSSLQSAALNLLGENDPLLQFVGAVSSAQLSADSWVAWHHTGPAIRRWAEGQTELHRTICWMHGDSTRCRSFLVGLQNPNVSQAAIQPKAVLWSQPPATIPDELMRWGSGDQAGELVCLPHAPDREQFQHYADGDAAASVLCIADDLSGSVAGDISSNLISTWLFAGSDLAGREFARQPLNGCVFLSELEQKIASEAYDFQRWTGLDVDVGILRDAYDEYCAF